MNFFGSWSSRIGCFLLAGFLGNVCLKAQTFYVSPGGNDGNAGVITSPFLTLTQAQAAVRAALPTATGPVTVWMRGGTYHLGQPLAFGPEDSGSAIAPVTYSAYSNETVVLSGAIKLNPVWTPYSGNPAIKVANIGTNLDIDGLFVNGAQQVLARYPNYNPNVVILNGYAADCISSNRAARWSNPTTGLVRGLHGSMWGGNSFKITGINSSTGIPTLAWVGDNNRGSSLHATYRMVENLFEELDTTNEWFYNRSSGELYFWPPAGLDLASATVEAASLSELAGFRGAATNDTVSHITLAHLIFTQTHRTLFNSPYEGLMRGDWGVARAGTIYLSNAENIVVRDCVFTNVGGNGIFMSACNRSNVVNANTFENVGASCVQIVGLMSATRYPSTWAVQHTDIQDTNAGPLTLDYPRDIVVSSNYMHNMGMFEKQSSGVNLSVAEDITVSHNTIHTCPRAGLNVIDGCFGGKLIEFNDVWDCVLETGDHGGFNSWGRDRFYSYLGVNTTGGNGVAKRPYAFLDCRKPTIIRNNRFQNSTGTWWGIDLDDGSSNYQIYNNVCLNAGIKLREGFDRHVFNNIIINESGNFHVWYDACQDRVDHNVIVNPSPWALIGLNADNLPAKQATIDTNFFWNGGAAITLPFSGWTTSSGYDVHSLTVDPEFSDVGSNDYTVNNAQILAAGFTNIPMDQFGTTRPGTPTPPPIGIVQLASLSADTHANQFLGATITGIFSDGVLSATGLGDTNGVYFETVSTGSVAAKQGFRANDVIREVNGVVVTDLKKFHTLCEAVAPGSRVPIVLWRDQAPQKFTFTKPR